MQLRYRSRSTSISYVCLSPRRTSEIIQKIVLFATDATPVGPPRELARLIQTCQTSHRTLTIDSSDLYTKILFQKFDISSTVHRLGKAVVRANAKEELQRRFTALKCFRQGEQGLDDPCLKDYLWIAYIMLLDSDPGQQNIKQLLWAKLPDFIDAYLIKKLATGSSTNHHWPLNNEINSLVVAIKWLLSSYSAAKHKSQNVRDEILNLLTPYVFAAFRYALSTIPEHLFNSENHTTLHNSTASVHGPYPPSSLTPSQVVYFGRVTQEVPVPSVVLHSILLRIVDFESLNLTTPSHLFAAEYKTRAEADSNSHLGPTLEDITYVARNNRTHFPFVDAEPGNVPRSLTLTSYRLGDLTGQWKGSFIMPFLHEYQGWLNQPEAPKNPINYCWHPFSFTIQEHYTCDASVIIPADKAENGASNAWLPPNFKWVQQPNGIEAVDHDGTVLAFYRSFRPDEPPPCCSKVVDVVIMGKADKRHAAAWEPFRILGRVRLSDGLVMMVKESLDNLGNWLMRGYMTPSRNLVGRLRTVSNGLAPADWEGAFSLGKEEAGTGGSINMR